MIEKRKKKSEYVADYIDERTGAWHTVPWPSDPDEKRRLVGQSLGALIIRWAENRLTDEEFEQYGPGLINPITGYPMAFNHEQRRRLMLHYAFDPETGEWLHRDEGRISRDQILMTAIAVIDDIGPSQLVWSEVDGAWLAVSRVRCRVPSFLSDDAKAWHGVTA